MPESVEARRVKVKLAPKSFEGLLLFVNILLIRPDVSNPPFQIQFKFLI